MSKISLDRERTGLLLVTLITLAGGGLRAWIATRGLIADEVGWVIEGGPAGNWTHGETAVNPPALRMLFAALASEPAQVPWIGRAWSWLAGTLSIPLMYRLGRTVGRDSIPVGLVAAAILATFPLGLSQSGLYRSYATLTLVLCWHLLALQAFVDRSNGPPRREAGTAFALSALLLPQIHYSTVPILFFEGLVLALWLRRLDVIRYYFPAAIFFAPLAIRIVSESSEHLPPTRTLAQSVRVLLTGDLDTDLLPMALLATAVGWLQVDHRARVHVLVTLAAAAGLTLTASYHDARGDLAVILAICTIPMLAALPMLVRGGSPELHRLRGVGWAGILLAWGTFVWEADRRVMNPYGPEAVVHLAEDFADGSWPDDRPTWLYSPESIHPLYFALEGEPPLQRCAPNPEGVCFAYGQAWVFPLEWAPTEPGYIVVLEAGARDEWFSVACKPIRHDERYHTWDCPNGWSPPD